MKNYSNVSHNLLSTLDATKKSDKIVAFFDYNAFTLFAMPVVVPKSRMWNIPSGIGLPSLKFEI